jgi:hypothetical protein
MHNFHLLSAVLAATFFAAHTAIFAQSLPAVPFNANDSAVNATGQNAEVISISGTIPEFIQFVTVDNVLEMGDLGGPLHTGSAFSTIDLPGATAATTVTGGGIAEITFDANTYVQARLETERQLINAGPDGILQRRPDGTYFRPEFDNFRIGVNYRLALKGIYQRKNTTAVDPGGVVPTTPFTTSVNYGAWTTQTEEVASVDGKPSGRSDAVLTFAPNGGSGGIGSNGFKVGARASRKGLNDYFGPYTAVINLKYWKW